MTNRYIFLLGLVVAGLGACGADEPVAENAEVPLSLPIAVAASGGNPLAEAAANQITDEYMREIIAEISSDAYEGRGPASAGDKKARAYLVSRMQELGLEPGGEGGSFEQPFDLVGVNTLAPETWSFEGNDKSLTVEFYDQFMINSYRQQPRSEVNDAEIVFAGYGIQAPEYDWDDYKNVDVTGKIGHHHECTSENCHKKQLLTRIILRDLLADFGQLGIDFLSCDQGLDVHPLSSLANTER